MLKPRTVRDPAGPFGHLEHPGEMVRLAGIGDVHNTVGTIPLRSRSKAVADRRQISGGVVEAAVALLHDHRQGLAVLALHPLKEHALGTVIGDQQLSGLQAINHRRQEGVVERFPAFAEADVEPVVDLLELAPRLVAEQAPGLERHRIAPLQLHHLVAGGGLELSLIHI